MSGYNVQRWFWTPGGMLRTDAGKYVLAADAEQHEREAVEAAERDAVAAIRSEARAVTELEQELSQARERAIEDCMNAIASMRFHYLADAQNALSVLAALLTKGSEK